MNSFKMAIRSIVSNKLRAFLTMLGIIIGVMALVVLVSLVNGATGTVTDTVSSLGSDVVTVSVSDDKGLPLSLEDVEAWVDKYPAVGAVAPYHTGSTTVKYGSESESLTAYGVTPSYYDVEGLGLVIGRFIKRSDIDNHTRVAVINNAAATDLIGYLDCVGEEISLNGMKFTVIGVLEESDTNALASLLYGSYAAYIPYTTLPRLTDSVNADVTTLYADAADGFTMEQCEKQIEEVLLARFEEDEDAFSSSSTNIVEDAMSDITSVLSILLGGIAAISLIVGGIGIMNIMLVTVTERTREIGIRKAIGATRGKILWQFLLEAVILCMMGCAAGIFISWSILRVVSVIVSSLSMSFSLDGTVVSVAVIFCFVIGLVFGLYPANKAAKMKPIDALHYGG